MNTIYPIVFLFLLTGLNTSLLAQNNEEVIDSLYAVRMHLATQERDYSDIEKQIVASGIYPSVLATRINEQEGIRFRFNIYSPISGESNQHLMENRFRVTFPDIRSIEIREEKVNVLFDSATALEAQQLFFQYFGYSSIQLKN